MLSELTFAELKQQQQPVVLAPKNDVTQVVARYLQQHQIPFVGYSDSVQQTADCIAVTDIPSNAISLIFSNNHWKAIAQRLENTQCYVITAVDGGYRFIATREFAEYQPEQLRIHNNLISQQLFWQQHIEAYMARGEAIERYGYSWGDPEASQDPLGNYRWINDKVQSWIATDTTLLDLGTMSGKWLPFFLHAKQIICVDINDAFVDVVKGRFAEHVEKFRFYQTQGNELHGIASGSVDVVFCMDTLVRVDKNFIESYFSDIDRVLTPTGKFVIHLPCDDYEGSVSRNFTSISRAEIQQILAKLQRTARIVDDVIVHGVLVIAE